jgi:hypothetical protein
VLKCRTWCGRKENELETEERIKQGSERNVNETQEETGDYSNRRINCLII